MDISGDVLNYYSQPSVMTEVSKETLMIAICRRMCPVLCGSCKVC